MNMLRLIVFMLLLVIVLASSIVAGGLIEARYPVLGQIIGLGIFFGGLRLMGIIDDWLGG